MDVRLKRAEPIKASGRELMGIPASEWAAAKRKERIHQESSQIRRRGGGRPRRLFAANDSPIERWKASAEPLPVERAVEDADLQLWITRVAVNSPKIDVQQERPIPS
jgi:hypothetical protein